MDDDTRSRLTALKLGTMLDLDKTLSVSSPHPSTFHRPGRQEVSRTQADLAFDSILPSPVTSAGLGLWRSSGSHGSSTSIRRASWSRRRSRSRRHRGLYHVSINLFESPRSMLKKIADLEPLLLAPLGDPSHAYMQINSDALWYDQSATLIVILT
jgi:hypothetical protein